MKCKYGNIQQSSLSLNSNDIINQIFKLLPYKESQEKDLQSHFTTILFRINGMAQLFPSEPRWITVMALLESAKEENDFRLYRKAILDCCSIVRNITGDADA